MKSEDVLQIVTWLERAEIPVWLDGGWGVDALLGQQTRSHGRGCTWSQFKAYQSSTGEHPTSNF